MSRTDTSRKGAKAYRPLLSIEPVIKSVMRKFEIKETSAELITQYAKFMTERSGSPVREDAVVEHLALLIGKDKGFRDWAKSTPSKPSPEKPEAEKAGA